MGNQFTFELWKTILRRDCQRGDKLLAFGSLGDICLEVLGDRNRAICPSLYRALKQQPKPVAKLLLAQIIHDDLVHLIQQ
jgi:hypothetical protein